MRRRRAHVDRRYGSPYGLTSATTDAQPTTNLGRSLSLSLSSACCDHREDPRFGLRDRRCFARQAAVLVHPAVRDPGGEAAAGYVHEMRRLWRVIVLVAVAYGVGFSSDGFLNDDPCSGVMLRELDSYESIPRWFPVRTDCRITTPGGVVTVTRGSSEVFWAMFTLTLVSGLVLLASIGLAFRLAVVAIAAIAALLVIFVF